MALSLTSALAPLAKVQRNLQKFVAQAQSRVETNNAELVSAKETFKASERRLTNSNTNLTTEMEQANAVIDNLSKLLGK